MVLFGGQIRTELKVLVSNLRIQIEPNQYVKETHVVQFDSV